MLIKITKIDKEVINGVCMNSAEIKKGKAIASPSGFFKTTDIEITNKVLEIITTLRPEICVFSYIENKFDILNFKKLIYKHANYLPHIMSKIECQEAVNNVDSIIDNSESIMIARGCLAVNVGFENMIEAQDIIITECLKKRKDVCIASNILRSLNIQNCPSRADVVDLFYMIIKGINWFVITDGFCMEEKFDNFMYFMRNIYFKYSIGDNNA